MSRHSKGSIRPGFCSQLHSWYQSCCEEFASSSFPSFFNSKLYVVEERRGALLVIQIDPKISLIFCPPFQKADKSALAAKVSRSQFDATTEQLHKMMQELLNKMTGQEQDWQKMLDKLLIEMDSKVNEVWPSSGSHRGPTNQGNYNYLIITFHGLWLSAKAGNQDCTNHLPTHPGPGLISIHKEVSSASCLACTSPCDQIGPYVMHTVGTVLKHMWLPCIDVPGSTPTAGLSA